MWSVAALLTGVGYIGSALLARLMERGERVVGLESFYSTPPDALAGVGELPEGAFALVTGDVASAEDVEHAFARLSAEAPMVYHLAAQPSAARAAVEPEITERSNLTGARVILEAARRSEGKVVFGGSFRVYGDDLAGRMVDERTPYGRVGDLSHLSKVYVEQLARMLEVRFVSVRLGVTYGLAPITKHVPHFMTVPNLFCLRAARGEPLAVLEDRAMAFIHVEDAARALLCAADMANPGRWSAVNAAPEVRTISQVAQLVQRLGRERGLEVRVRGAAPASEGFTVTSDLESAGFRPRRHMDQDLGAVLDHFLAAERAA